MTHRFYDSIPAPWKRGLLPIPPLYILGLLLVIFIDSSAQSAKSVIRELNTLTISMTEAAEAKNQESIAIVTRQLDQCTAKLLTLRNQIWGLLAILLACVSAFCLFAWQLTTYPTDNWEIWARRAIFAIPLVVILKWSAAFPLGADLALKAISLALATGIERAYMKICAASGNFDIAERIQRIYQLLFGLVLAVIGLGVLAGMNKMQGLANLLLVPTIYLGSIGLMLALTWQLWQLRRRLEQQDDPWNDGQKD